MNKVTLLKGDCINKLKGLKDNSVDSVVTDPPYEIGFMGKGWDDSGIANNPELWKEVLRVLKPGGHLLSFSHSRTYHRQAVAVEDAGFEIRDQIMWIYGSGFPKSHNIGKSVDKLQGNEREYVGEINDGRKGNNRGWKKSYVGSEGTGTQQYTQITKGNSQYEGWGTALKPAHEPIVMARKPLSEKTVAQNVLEHGTGGINIDECRIGTTDNLNGGGYGGNNVGVATYALSDGRKTLPTNKLTKDDFIQPEGRFPANIIFECTCDNPKTAPAPKSGHWPKGKTKGFGEFGGGESSYEGVGPKEDGNMVIHTDPNCPCRILDEQSGNKTGQRGVVKGTEPSHSKKNAIYGDYSMVDGKYAKPMDNLGGASRFFYCPKASKKDRNDGCDELEEKQSGHNKYDKCNKCNKYLLGQLACECAEPERTYIASKNHHPTVKPTDLMAYLVRLVTPKGGTVLDPFMGSGSTGKASVREGFDFIGIEREDEYMEIAKTRIQHEEGKHKYRTFFDAV